MPVCNMLLSDHSLSHKPLLDASEGHITQNDYVEGVSIGDYIVIKELGSGSTARVVLAFDKNTERRVAIKIVKRKPETTCTDEAKQGFNDERIYRETVISVLLDHPHIVKLLDFLYSDSYFFLIFEYVKGNQLFDVILKESKIDEEKARKYFRQIVSAVGYIHKNSIVHRDLKIENIIVDINDNIKILDFGLSNFYDNKIFLKTACGSLYFAAPELLLGNSYSGPEVDVWSLGVILYVMLCGKVPFDDESVRELQNKIKTASFEFRVSLSRTAQDLINGMIQPDPTKRLTVDGMIKHKWMNIGYPSQTEIYVGKRFPITRLNEEYLKALESALSFQFHDTRDELESFFKACKQHSESLDSIYWTKNPVISLYYLLSENIGSYSRGNPRSLKFDDDSSQTPEILHKFVRFVFFNDSSQRPSKYFFKGVFKESSSETDSNSNTPSLPNIQKSYLKGLIQGIRVKHVGSHNAFKKLVLDVFQRHSIVFETDEKGYFCSFTKNDEECYFKATLYYNVIFSEYYLVMKCLNSRKSSFKHIYRLVEDSLKY